MIFELQKKRTQWHDLHVFAGFAHSLTAIATEVWVAGLGTEGVRVWMVEGVENLPMVLDSETLDIAKKLLKASTRKGFRYFVVHDSNGKMGAYARDWGY